MEKIIKGIMLSALSTLFLALASAGTVRAEEALPDLSMEGAPAEDLSMGAEPQRPGRIESTGIYFEVKDSEWLNLSAASSELIKLTLESVPNMITMHIEAAWRSFYSANHQRPGPADHLPQIRRQLPQPRGIHY